MGPSGTVCIDENTYFVVSKRKTTMAKKQVPFGVHERNRVRSSEPSVQEYVLVSPQAATIDDEAVNLGQLKSTLLSPIMANLIFKGFGNTDFQNVENGDYRIITNSSNELSVQYYTSGAWDSVNETILATPS